MGGEPWSESFLVLDPGYVPQQNGLKIAIDGLKLCLKHANVNRIFHEWVPSTEFEPVPGVNSLCAVHTSHCR